MKGYINYCYLVVFLLLSACQSKKDHAMTDYGIIPFPNELIPQSGKFLLKGEVEVLIPADSMALNVFRYLKNSLKQTTITFKQVDQEAKASLKLIINETLPDEAYILNVSPENIELQSNKSGSGFFYGMQSLLQLMPTEIYQSQPETKLATIEIPSVRIQDTPRFPYRGAMIDVGRNFMPKEFVMKFIDLMAMYKLNRLHFHLTDDQGWRIEIKKYPKLTDIGSVRKQTLIGHSDYYWPRQYEVEERGGYYTQEDIKEIVRYAQERFVTVIPEIEIPGHSSAALAAYPELSCGLGKTYYVQDYWDVFDEVYCPKKKTFEFLEDVLTEVIALFPSHYIHIGGDECPKKAWKRCDHCQSLMKQEQLKDEEALQSWFIHRIEKFVNSKGRDIIGWDEILEGGLAPNATVMSWRGEKGGIIAAKSKHRAIMTPGDYCYLDHYQQDSEFAPLAIGSFLPLDSVYAYDPIPRELAPEEQAYIIGTQSNIWGEYIQTPHYLEYMAFPRMLAMAEVQWTKPEKKDFSFFTHRLIKGFHVLDYCKINACRNFFEVNFWGAWNQTNTTYEVTLKTFYPEADIYYSLNDSIVTTRSNLYKNPVCLSEDATIYAAVYKEGKPLGKITCKSFAVNKATGCGYKCLPDASWERINYGFGLTDGIRGISKDLRCWTGFDTDTVRIDIDLRKLRLIKKVTFSSLFRSWDSIWPAREMNVCVSTDGWTFTKVGIQKLTYDLSVIEGTRFPSTLSFPAVQAAYVRLQLLGGGLCPKGYYNEGKQSKLALDEIEIY